MQIIRIILVYTPPSGSAGRTPPIPIAGQAVAGMARTLLSVNFHL